MMRDFLATEGGQLCRGGRVESCVISEQGGARWHGYIVIVIRVTRNIFVIDTTKYLHEKSCNVRVINLLAGFSWSGDSANDQ